MLGYLAGNVEAERPGYTKAVDMWSVGCVTVVLLTGGLAFTDPITNVYSERLARDCNLEVLQKSKDWQMVRRRPQEFVEKLLVLDESTRLTADEALRHSWFYNEVHKNDFEELYQRTIKNWHPRPPKKPVVDFNDTSGSMRSLVSAASIRSLGRESSPGRQNAVEPPYLPFPRNMHAKNLWPRRNPGARLSEEVLTSADRWVPGSAADLRLRANLFPTRTTVLPSATIVEPLRSTRATSEPPPNRMLLGSGNERKVRDARDTSSPMSREPSSTSPRTPRLRKAVLRTTEPLPLSDPAYQYASPTRPSQDSSRGYGSNTIARLDAPLPNALRQIDTASFEKMSENTTTVHLSPGANSSMSRPRSIGNLKRRVSTPSPNLALSKRRGSIFDLAEDIDPGEEKTASTPSSRRSVFDLDVDDNRPARSRTPSRSQRTPLTHRLRMTVAHTLNKRNGLYLPR
jgi:serine/threonine protein kinase